MSQWGCANDPGSGPTSPMSLSNKLDYYDVLGIPPDASSVDIRETYHRLCKAYHPDRTKRAGKSEFILEQWSQIQSAWKCLSDPCKRLTYDIRREGRFVSSSEAARCYDLLEKQASIDIDNMRVLYKKVAEHEKKAGGVVIVSAFYGEMQPDKIPTPTRTCIDVTIPLQCCVDSHRIVLAEGASKGDLTGFYNPLVITGETCIEPVLYIVYNFKSKLHETTVGDTDSLWMPLKKHVGVVDDSSYFVPRGPDARVIARANEPTYLHRPVRSKFCNNGRWFICPKRPFLQITFSVFCLLCASFGYFIYRSDARQGGVSFIPHQWRYHSTVILRKYQDIISSSHRELTMALQKRLNVCDSANIISSSRELIDRLVKKFQKYHIGFTKTDS